MMIVLIYPWLLMECLSRVIDSEKRNDKIY